MTWTHFLEPNYCQCYIQTPYFIQEQSENPDCQKEVLESTSFCDSNIPTSTFTGLSSKMPRSEEAASWYTMVYRAVQEVPPGKVTSYGHIAALLGYPERPRQVGMCLKYLPSAADQPDARYNSETVPWQRVINSKGVISNRGANGAARQETALNAEGVDVGRGDLGERTVDFSVYGWFPNQLPSEENSDA